MQCRTSNSRLSASGSYLVVGLRTVVLVALQLPGSCQRPSSRAPALVPSSPAADHQTLMCAPRLRTSCRDSYPKNVAPPAQSHAPPSPVHAPPPPSGAPPLSAYAQQQQPQQQQSPTLASYAQQPPQQHPQPPQPSAHSGYPPYQPPQQQQQPAYQPYGQVCAFNDHPESRPERITPLYSLIRKLTRCNPCMHELSSAAGVAANERCC